jgi:hypothetical protein
VSPKRPRGNNAAGPAIRPGPPRLWAAYRGLRTNIEPSLVRFR